MGNSFSKKNNMNYKAITFWALVGLLTLSFVIYIVVKFTERTLRPVENFDKVQVYGNDMYEKQEEKYFVYIYGTEENEKVNELEEHILNYLTFIKRNSKEEKAINLYTFNVNARSNARYLDSYKPSTLKTATSEAGLNIVKSDVPTLLVMSKGKVVTTYAGLNEIKEAVLNIIGSVENPK